MKVIHIFKITGIAGSENHLLTLLPALKNKGIDIVVIMLEKPNLPIDEFYKKLTIKGILVYRIKIGLDLSLPVYKKIKEIFKAEEPDIVHTHLIHGDLYGILAAKSCGIKKIVSSKHNDNKFRRNLFIKVLNSYLYKQVAKIIVISEALKKFSIEVERIPQEKITIIKYGLDSFKSKLKNKELRIDLGYNPKDIVFGIVARLTEQKGHVYLLEAFKNIAKKYKNAKLLIVGDGMLRKQLETIVKNYNIESFVQLLGRREDTADIYNAIDVFILPSLWEGFGLVFLEAMSFGLPIIASDVSAVPEIIVNNKTGLLVSPKNPKELVNAMESMIINDNLRLQLGKSGVKRVLENFSVNKMVEKTRDVYLNK